MKNTDNVVVDSEPLMRHEEQLDKRFADLERLKVMNASLSKRISDIEAAVTKAVSVWNGQVGRLSEADTVLGSAFLIRADLVDEAILALNDVLNGRRRT